MTAWLVDPAGHDAVTVFVPTTKTTTSGPAKVEGERVTGGVTVEYLTVVDPTMTPSLAALTTEPSMSVAAGPPRLILVESMSMTPAESQETLVVLVPTVRTTTLVTAGAAVMAE